MSDIYVAIMAGGVGSRFWPSSTTAKPKQFLDILGTGKSLLRITFERFQRLTHSENIFIVTNEAYFSLIKNEIPEIKDAQILTEPSRNNTGPCIAYTSLKIANLNPNANLVIAPSDHLILKEDKFIETIREGLAFTQKNEALITLGILPTRPDTGYGYIQFDKHTTPQKVLKFTEKPPLEIAEKMFKSGDYLWNAGIFIAKTSTLISSFKTLAPEINTILNHPTIYNTSQEKSFIQKNYPSTPNISFDYAIMEKANNVFTIPGDFGWSDLGTWASLYNEVDKTMEGNYTSHTNIYLEQVQNSFVKLPENIGAVIKGLDNYLIILDNNVLLIWPKNLEQEIKTIASKLDNH
jgi:mannose-1-phosphate guanylyltransferase